ncbi:UNVERIFIED_CONTAM: hypothetical protein NCL1_50179 [Trichonephila clavipes]
MARYPNTTPLRGILRDTDRNVLQSFQQRTATYDSQQDTFFIYRQVGYNRTQLNKETSSYSIFSPPNVRTLN